MFKEVGQNSYICFSTQLKSQNTIEFYRVSTEIINQFKVSKAFFSFCITLNKPKKTNFKCLRSYSVLTSMIPKVCCLQHCNFSPSSITSSYTGGILQTRRLVWDPVTAAFPCCLSHLPKLLILSQKSLSPLDLIYVMITNSYMALVFLCAHPS